VHFHGKIPHSLKNLSGHHTRAVLNVLLWRRKYLRSEGACLRAAIAGADCTAVQPLGLPSPSQAGGSQELYLETTAPAQNAPAPGRKDETHVGGVVRPLNPGGGEVSGLVGKSADSPARHLTTLTFTALPARLSVVAKRQLGAKRPSALGQRDVRVGGPWRFASRERHGQRERLLSHVSRTVYGPAVNVQFHLKREKNKEKLRTRAHRGPHGLLFLSGLPLHVGSTRDHAFKPGVPRRGAWHPPYYYHGGNLLSPAYVGGALANIKKKVVAGPIRCCHCRIVWGRVAPTSGWLRRD